MNSFAWPHYWFVPPGTQVNVQGYVFSAGICYLTEAGGRTEASAIDSALSLSGPDASAFIPATEWPAYYELLAELRADYLRWLKAERNGTCSPYSRALFLMTVERFIASGGPALKFYGWQVARECRRLADVYADDRAFADEARIRADIVEVGSGFDILPSRDLDALRLCEVAQRIGLAQAGAAGSTLGAQWTYVLARLHPQCESEIKALSARPEVFDLFAAHFRARFPRGLTLPFTFETSVAVPLATINPSLGPLLNLWFGEQGPIEFDHPDAVEVLGLLRAAAGELAPYFESARDGGEPAFELLPSAIQGRCLAPRIVLAERYLAETEIEHSGVSVCSASELFTRFSSHSLTPDRFAVLLELLRRRGYAAEPPGAGRDMAAPMSFYRIGSLPDRTLPDAVVEALEVLAARLAASHVRSLVPHLAEAAAVPPSYVGQLRARAEWQLAVGRTNNRSLSDQARATLSHAFGAFCRSQRYMRAAVPHEIEHCFRQLGAVPVPPPTDPRRPAEFSIPRPQRSQLPAVAHIPLVIDDATVRRNLGAEAELVRRASEVAMEVLRAAPPLEFTRAEIATLHALRADPPTTKRELADQCRQHSTYAAALINRINAEALQRQLAAAIIEVGDNITINFDSLDAVLNERSHK